MSELAIKAENISKLYRLGNVSAASFKADAYKLWAKMTGQEDPTIQLAQVNDRTQKNTSDYVWALKDINFEVKQGDVLGIIGRNGAGKSTLLKILSKVTAPTTGSIKVKGRIASLLEVGTGFHPELTGNENIYLNGHILGMTKREIDRKFDEIIDFAGVEKYLNTPVKRYSSGMYVRLAFAVAAHLEPDILVVDEVLAVGDAEFQKKCLGKMHNVSKNDGRTILFVSHNMAAIENLCETGIVLTNGTVHSISDSKTAIANYLALNPKEASTNEILPDTERAGNGELKFTRVAFLDQKSDTEITEVQSGSNIKIRLFFEKRITEAKDVLLAIGINDIYGHRITFMSNEMLNQKIVLPPNGSNYIDVVINKLPLAPGRYDLTLFISIRGEIADWIQNAFSFTVSTGDFYNTGRLLPAGQGNFLMQYSFA